MNDMASSTFPLRFTVPQLRDAVRQIAKHEHISQNEYIEQAIVNDLTLRGALRAEHLRAAADQLAGIAAGQMDALIERSLQAFAEGEVLPDPVEMHQRVVASVSSATSPEPDPQEDSPVHEAAASFRSHR